MNGLTAPFDRLRVNGFLPFVERGKEEFGLQCPYNYGLISKEVSFQNAVPKEGIGTRVTGKLNVSLSELTRPFKLGGTLAHPSLAVDPTQTAIAVGKAIGGTMLFGPVGIAAALVGSSSGDENSCLAAIEAANKGVRAKKGLVGDVVGGAEDILKGAGKELKKLFGK